MRQAGDQRDKERDERATNEMKNEVSRRPTRRRTSTIVHSVTSIISLLYIHVLSSPICLFLFTACFAHFCLILHWYGHRLVLLLFFFNSGIAFTGLHLGGGAKGGICPPLVNFRPPPFRYMCIPG